jgi:hypothetical protein
LIHDVVFYFNKLNDMMMGAEINNEKEQKDDDEMRTDTRFWSIVVLSFFMRPESAGGSHRYWKNQMMRGGWEDDIGWCVCVTISLCFSGCLFVFLMWQ